jgi:hypothetical protein
MDHKSVRQDTERFPGDYISYMTPDTKETRRAFWKSHNFAGTVDWAVDLQAFTLADANDFSDRPASGEGCVSGYDTTLDSDDLCEFTCALGFCPEPLCSCRETGEMDLLPNESDRNVSIIVAYDELNVNLNRVYKFACQYGYCPEELCFDKPQETAPVPPVKITTLTGVCLYQADATFTEIHCTEQTTITALTFAPSKQSRPGSH